jgi:two-component system chemotaxis response regulator CheB
MKPIRVMIVEDSRVVREHLEHVVRSDPRLAVAGAYESAEAALVPLPGLRPDVISMDIRLPGMNGFGATQRIMSELPTPIIVVSAGVECSELKISMNALRAGALAVVEKPAGTTHKDYQALAARLCDQLVLMSQVKVVRQRFNRGPAGPNAVETAFCPRPSRITRPWRAPFQIAGIVASTGGPSALARLLGGLPSDFPLPIVLVQHITSSFHAGFVSWLDGISELSVVTAQDGQRPAAGMVYVAPADRHLQIEHGCMTIGDGEPVCGQAPSGTVLFESLATSYGSDALGILLTGMGQDGAEGLKSLREAGGYTLAEDESTAVVYGMPAVAARMGAVCESLPLDDICRRLQCLAGAAERVTR